MNSRELKISVRNLIEFILRHGSINNGYIGNRRAQEGTKAHQYLQKENLKFYDQYKKEVYLKYTFPRTELSITVEGRADGIITNEGNTIIEEIKSTEKELSRIEEENNPLHWAQVKFYGFMYMIQNNQSGVELQLAYIHLESNAVKKFNRKYGIEELEHFVNWVVDEYVKWAVFRLEWAETRNGSIRNLQFPFESYRAGQRELAVAVYNTIRAEGMIFAQAPTGIGKTISTMFPAVKSLGESLSDRVFYLTAKTITRTVAEESLRLMREGCLRVKSVTLTAKDKICFNAVCSCNEDDCLYAKGYFDKVNEALFEILSAADDFSREKIEEEARKYEICPFEFSLEISNWCDVIIGDYNYVFDPRVYLRRFFEESTERYIFLIDEAHNLVSRGREMFSASIEKSKIMTIKKLLKGEKKLVKYLNKINTCMANIKKEMLEQGNFEKIIEEPAVLYEHIRGYLKECDEFLVTRRDFTEYEQVLELYFELNTFLNISGFYDENYVTISKIEGDKFFIKLFCVNPRKNMMEGMKRASSQIIFSATLSPGSYFLNLLGGDERTYKISLPSPFPKENMLTLIAPVSTRFRHREATIRRILSMIINFVRGKKGNYMCFFPSYKYMKQAKEILEAEYKDIDFIPQVENMSEEEKEIFLGKFKEQREKCQLGLCIMGGIFSEGIDLTGDSLIGAIIVGVGLPQISFEQNIIKDFFKENGEGYDYAYTYPGINKVMQAVGRVIRREEDRGAVLMIDDRLLTAKYIRLIPENWRNFKVVKNEEEIRGEVSGFWID